MILYIYDVPDYHNPERANGQSVLYADDSENVGQSVHEGFLLVFQRCYFLIDFDKMFVDSAFPMYLGSIFWLWDGRFIMAEIWFSCGKSKNKKPNWGCSVPSKLGFAASNQRVIRVIRRPTSPSLPRRDVEWSMSWEAWQLINECFCSTTSDVSNAMPDSGCVFHCVDVTFGAQKRGVALSDLAHWTHQEEDTKELGIGQWS